MLTPADLLDFEAAWPHPRRGEKDLAIERTLGVRPARYYQLLHRAARSLEGQRHDPITAHRVVGILQRGRLTPGGGRCPQAG